MECPRPCLSSRSSWNRYGWRALAVVMLMVAASLFLRASSASAAWGGANGKIIFWDHGLSTNRIWSVNPDGSDLSVILHSPAQLADIDGMDIAPDGSALLFFEDNLGGLFLFPLIPSVPDLDQYWQRLDDYGSGRNRAGLDRYASFSPDGGRVLWVRYPVSDPASAGVWVINRDGSGKRQLVASTTADDPRWSPDGTEVSYRDAGSTYVIPADGSGLPMPALEAFPLSPGLSPVSPDGRKIAFFDCCDADTDSVPQLYISNLDGSDRQRVTAKQPCSTDCTADLSTYPFSSPAYVRWQTLSDPTPPVIQSNISGQLGNDGWYVSDVAISWTVGDPESNVASATGCDPSNVTTDTASLTRTCTAKNRWGTSASEDVHIKRDATPPAVAYSGNAGAYTVDQAVNITCSATDALSGIASSTCQDITGPAYGFSLGSHTISATANDNAGNAGNGSATFTVSVTPRSLCDLTQQLIQTSPRYLGSARVGRFEANALGAAACQVLGSIRLRSNPRVRAALIHVYDNLVNILARQDWLTKGETLEKLADAL